MQEQNLSMTQMTRGKIGRANDKIVSRRHTFKQLKSQLKLQTENNFELNALYMLKILQNKHQKYTCNFQVQYLQTTFQIFFEVKVSPIRKIH